MAPEDWQTRIDALFVAAVALHESERASFLDKACASDPSEYRIEVERLIQADGRAGADSDFLSGPYEHVER